MKRGFSDNMLGLLLQQYCINNPSKISSHLLQYIVIIIIKIEPHLAKEKTSLLQGQKAYVVALLCQY